MRMMQPHECFFSWKSIPRLGLGLRILDKPLCSLALEGAGRDVKAVTSVCILFIPEFHWKASPLVASNCPHSDLDMK